MSTNAKVALMPTGCSRCAPAVAVGEEVLDVAVPVAADIDTNADAEVVVAEDRGPMELVAADRG